MKFCSDCFNDSEIKSIINSIDNHDICDVLNKESDHVYDTTKHTVLTNYFDTLIELYTPASECKTEIDENDYVKLKYDLKDTWGIFDSNCSHRNVHNIVKSICEDKYNESKQIFNDNIVIEELHDINYKKEHSLLSGYSWDDFCESLKKRNRFHTSIFNTKLFSQYCWAVQKKYKTGTKFFRARISSKNGFDIKNMGCPPFEFSKAGRVNAEGVECLYLSNNLQTTINEIRPGVGDYITVATFELQEDILVADLKEINRISPFSELSPSFMIDYALNKEILHKIHEEMSKVVRHSDSKLDYVPTQYICDFIKTLEQDKVKFAGVEYCSTVRPDGYNVAVFDQSLFKGVDTRIIEIASLHYDQKVM